MFRILLIVRLSFIPTSPIRAIPMNNSNQTIKRKPHRVLIATILSFGIVPFVWIAISPVAQGQLANRELLPRQWKSKDNKFSTLGTIVELVEEKVRIRKADGKTADVPIAKLSSADHNYIKETIKVDPKANISMGKVTKILADNSIEFTDIDGAALSVRLGGLNFSEASPSINQNLSTSLLEHFCWIESTGVSGEGLSGVVFVHGTNVNLDLIAKGLVKYDPFTKPDPRFARAEKYADAKKLGVWKK